jgi:hypothetical protein
VEYTEYETALLNERQKFGFGTSVVSRPYDSQLFGDAAEISP